MSTLSVKHECLVSSLPPCCAGAFRDIRKHLKVNASSEIFFSSETDYGSAHYADEREELYRQHSDFDATVLPRVNFVRIVKVADEDFVYIYKSSVDWWLECEIAASSDHVYLGQDVTDDLWRVILLATTHDVPDSGLGAVRKHPLLKSVRFAFVTSDGYLTDGGPELTPRLRYWSVCVPNSS